MTDLRSSFEKSCMFFRRLSASFAFDTKETGLRKTPETRFEYSQRLTMMKVFWNCHIIIEKGQRIHNKLCTQRPLLLKACPVWISFGNRTSYPTFKGPDLPSRLKEGKPSPQRQQPHTPVKRTRGKLSICLWHSGRHAPGCPGAQFAFKNSMIRWFCNSHYVSQLAAFFIDARAKRSTVKSCQMFFSFGSSLPKHSIKNT